MTTSFSRSFRGSKKRLTQRGVATEQIHPRHEVVGVSSFLVHALSHSQYAFPLSTRRENVANPRRRPGDWPPPGRATTGVTSA